MSPFLHARKYFIITILILSTISALMLITPGQAASQPAYNDGWIDFGGSSKPSAASLSVTRGDGVSIDLSAVVPGVRTGPVTLAGTGYSRLYGDNLGVGATAGLPDLPVLRRQVEIPFGAAYSLELRRASVTETSLLALGLQAPLAPLQPPDCKCDDQPAPFTLDGAAYARDAYFPSQPIAITDEYIQRGHRIVTVEIWPVAYNPKRDGLLFYSQVDFRINLSGSDLKYTQAQADRYASPAFEGIMARDVLYFNQGQSPHAFTQADPVGYLIISADAFYNNMTPFVALKQEQGFTVTHTLLSTIGTTPTAIQTYIQDAYHDWPLPPSYVLLVGDTNTLATWTGPVIGTSTDLYYAAMDAPGTTDWHPDLGRGRFPARTTAQVDAMVNKYLAFAGLDGTEAWLKNAGFPATCDQYLVAEGTHNYVIDTYMIDHGFTGTFPNDPQAGGDKLYCVTYSATSTDVQNSLDEGRGVFIYSGHGSYTGWELYDQGSIPTITPGHYPFVASHACLTGDFGQTEVFGETWVLQDNKGALAYWGSATYSYWDEDDVLERVAFDTLFQEGVPQPDYTGMTYGGLAAVEISYPSSAQYYWETYNILGDPAGSIVLEPRLPDLELSVNPALVDICSAGTVSSTITASSSRAAGSTLELSAFDLSTGVTAELSPASFILPGESTLELTVQETATVGVYPLGIQAVIPDEVTKTVSVSLGIYNALPELPILTSPESEATNVPVRPKFTWNSAQGQAYDIQIATDSEFKDIVEQAEGLTDNSYVPSADLADNTVYYWRVMAHNTCGDSLYTPAIRFLTEPAFGQCSLGTHEVILLSEDFEDNLVGWSHGGIGDTWAQNSIRKHSGTSAFRAEDRPDVSEQWLVSPEIDLSGAGPFTLSFWNYQYLQNRSGGCYDGAILEVSTDGGASWTQLDSQLVSDPYNGPVAPDTSNPLAGKRAWCGKPQNWLDSLADLDEFTGKTVQLRFRLGTDITTGYEGWYVDDVIVKACTVSADFTAPSTGEVDAGSVVTHTFTLVNNGPTDMFALSLSDNAWQAEIVGSSVITVSQGSTATVQVRVTTPVGTPGSDSFTLTAVSVRVPGVIFTETGTTTTHEPEPVIVMTSVFLPIMKK
jgi:hypothetical protein